MKKIISLVLIVATVFSVISIIPAQAYKKYYSNGYFEIIDTYKGLHKYTGKKITTDWLVTLTKKHKHNLKKNTDYKVKYQNNINPGYTKITINFIGKYEKEKAIKFKGFYIYARPPKITKKSYNKNKFKLSVSFSKHKEAYATRVYFKKYYKNTKSYKGGTSVKYKNNKDTYTTPKLEMGELYKIIIDGCDKNYRATENKWFIFKIDEATRKIIYLKSGKNAR